jgi:hypothetical protein
MRARNLFAAGLLVAAAATTAQAQTISVEKPQCFPTEDNGLVKATISSPALGQTPRVYFRWREHEDFYWVAMEAEPGGRFWATPPKPEKRNELIEYYVALVDATGKAVSRSEVQQVKVKDDCKLDLGPKERGMAENLTVGETSAKQQGKKVLAFLCDGVVTRVNHAGVRRADEVCRACVVAWWQRKGVLIPVAGAGLVGIITTNDGREPSPARP